MPRKIAVTYRRVSTGKQADHGHSLSTQLSIMADWCGERGYEIIKNCADEGISGRSLSNREGLAEAIRICQTTKATLVVYSISRFARSTIDAINTLNEVLDAGGGLAIIDMGIDTSDANGRHYFRIMASQAEHESDMISQRVKAFHAANPGRCGEPPFGFVKDGEGGLLRDPDEWKIVLRIRRTRKNLSLVKTAERLNDEEVPTPTRYRHARDTRWHPEQVRRVLKAAGANRKG